MQGVCSFCGNAEFKTKVVEYVYRRGGRMLVVMVSPVRNVRIAASVTMKPTFSSELNLTSTRLRTELVKWNTVYPSRLKISRGWSDDGVIHRLQLFRNYGSVR
jgi:hypothetical protein